MIDTIALGLLAFLIWNYIVLPELWDHFVSPVRPFEKVVFFPTLGFPNPNGDGSYRVPIKVWVYQEQERMGKLQQRLAEYVASPSMEDKRRLTETTSWIVYKNRRCAQVSIVYDTNNHGQRLEHRFKKLTGPNGHVHEEIFLSKEISDYILTNCDGIFTFRALLQEDDSRQISGEARLLKTHGLSIISDIDDTIKITNVANKKELVKNTFSRPFQPVAGMPELYRRWELSFKEQHDVAFHYVSGSPWQLFHTLYDFLHSADVQFPRGSYNLKSFRIKDRNFFSLLSDPFAYKWKIIDPLFEALPNRKFILVGDSGEKDPEIYAALAKKYPTQVVHIFIRRADPPKKDDAAPPTPTKASSLSLSAKLGLTSSGKVVVPVSVEERLASVFAHLPPSMVTIFRSPLEEINDSILGL